jgi:ABC-type nitrate/sulfonate/bicarbonate transport system permease component
MDKTGSRLLPGLASFVVVLVIWELAGRYRLANPVLLPPPSVIGVTLWDIVRTGAFLAPLSQTFLLLFIGYVLACIFGIGVGVAMGRSEPIYCFLEPLIELLRPIPKAALVPPLFLFLGFGATMKITIVALAAFFPILIATIQGVRGVDKVALDTARTFGCPPIRMIFKIVLPASLPMIATGMRVGLGLGLILVVLAEMLAGEGGLGDLILDMQRSFAVRQMYAWIVILAVAGLTINAVFEFVEVRAIPWRSK